jgi:hypothetical protein
MGPGPVVKTGPRDVFEEAQTAHSTGFTVLEEAVSR